MTYSRYDEDKVVWKANLTQEDALGFNLDSFDPSERELMDDVQTEIMDKPDENIVRIENPCHFGFVFCGYRKGNYSSKKQHFQVVFYRL